MSIESVMPSNHFNLCRPLLLQPSIFPSIRVFSNEPALDIRWPKYQSSVSAPVLPINIQGWFPLGLTGLISLQSKEFCRIFSPVPQFESINSLVLSLLYGPTLTSILDYWKSIVLIMWTFVGKVISLLFNMLSRFIIAFLPRSKCLLISPSAVIWEPKKIKYVTASTFSPSIWHEVIGLDTMILVFLNAEF